MYSIDCLLGPLEVFKKFMVVGGGWWVVGGWVVERWPYSQQSQVFFLLTFFFDFFLTWLDFRLTRFGIENGDYFGRHQPKTLALHQSWMLVFFASRRRLTSSLVSVSAVRPSVIKFKVDSHWLISGQWESVNLSADISRWFSLADVCRQQPMRIKIKRS